MTHNLNNAQIQSLVKLLVQVSIDLPVYNIKSMNLEEIKTQDLTTIQGGILDEFCDIIIPPLPPKSKSGG